MKHLILWTLLLFSEAAPHSGVTPSDPAASGDSSHGLTPDGVALEVDTIATGLDTPWDIEWGPDEAIWVTERGGRVSRIDTARGEVVLAGEIEGVVERGESGLMGMAFHPDFERLPFVYFVHSYRVGGGIENRLIRARFEEGKLGPAEVLLDGIPGARIHDGSRLLVGEDRFLYVTTGDAARPALAQDRNSLAGKILRLTLEGKPAPGNPFGNEVWTYGHRNPQGIALQPGTGVLYVAEHGPAESDEVNRIERGRNYGWPEVSGHCDGGRERSFCEKEGVAEPVRAYTPTIGIAAATFYDSRRIPGWEGSLFVTSLVGRSLIRLTLNSDGRRITSEERLFTGQFGRLRDALVGADGALYLATSNRDGRGRPASRDDRILRIR